MRIRTIKPGFFTHEGISDLDPIARLLFIGLWCMADSAGRLEDRPKRIKVEVLPYDDCDVDALLDTIAALGFIERYEADGFRVIQVANFEKHQRMTTKELQTPSELPGTHLGHTWDESDSTRDTPGTHPDAQEGIGREEEGIGKDIRKGRERNSGFRFPVPTEDEWRDYCLATWDDWHPSCVIDSHSYYQSVGWRSKAGPIRDWKAAAKTAHGNATQWGKLQPRVQAVPAPTLDEWIEEGKRLNREARNGTPEWSWEACEAVWHDNQAKGWRFTQDWRAAILAAYNRFLGMERQFQDRRR